LLSATLMKNCAVRRVRSRDVRAMASVRDGSTARLARLLRLDRDRRARRLLLEVGREAAALDHEAADHAVELRAVVVLAFTYSRKFATVLGAASG
jgi:hypothetical protein